MTTAWSGVVAALDVHEGFRSSVSAYLHPLAGRSTLWHVVRALLDTQPPPGEVVVLHRDAAPTVVDVGDAAVRYVAVDAGGETRALRATLTSPGLKVLVDGAAPLVASATIARLLRAAEHAPVALTPEGEEAPLPLAVAGEGPALASAEDPRLPAASTRVAPTDAVELLRVVDRHTLSAASTAVRDRLVHAHERAGVSFLLPETSWLDVDVRIGPDTVIYPGVVIEGPTEIGSECVIGPHSRIVDSVIGRGVELKGWNYICRAHVRNRAVVEPYARRGGD